MPDNDLFNADNATTLAPNVTLSSQLENQETTRVVVTDLSLGNATISGNETSSLTNESSSVSDEKIAESTNATTSGRTTSGPTTFGPTTTISGNKNVTNVEIQRYEIDANNGLHVIYPAVAMSPGMYSLEIDYEILFDGKAIYSASLSEGK